MTESTDLGSSIENHLLYKVDDLVSFRARFSKQRPQRTVFIAILYDFRIF
jgi:hypothetical protein